MAEDANLIRRFVDLLVRRERALLAMRVVARIAVLALLVLACTVIASVARFDRGASTMVVVTLAGIGAWIAVAWPLLLEWRATGDALRQARRVEALRPDLRGRLVTAVGHDHRNHDPGTSADLLGLVVRRAANVVDDVGPGEVHDARPALGWAGVASLLWAAGLPLLLLVSGGPQRVMDFWLSGTSASARVADLTVDAPADVARVGDLIIRYTYPDYTGLEPKVVPNSTGDVQGPPGTVVEVTARSADVVEAAGLVAYDASLEALVTEGGRIISGQFSIAPEDGVYRLVLYRGGEPEPSRDFHIVSQEDLAPEVMLDVGGDEVIEIAVDDRFPITWQARDDYGVRSVRLAIDGKEVDRVLMRPEGRRAEVGDQGFVTPRDLGLAPGATARMSVVAWDNDTVSGSKRGVSRDVEIVVLGARGLDRRTSERRDELLEKMIPILARFLTEPWPVGDQSGEFAVWGEKVSNRYRPFVDAVEEVWSGISANSHDRAVAQRIVDTGRDLVRYTQVSFLPGSTDTPSGDAFLMTAQLRDDAIVAVEDGILAFHRMQRNQALAELADQANDLEDMAEQMKELLAQDDPDVQELLSRLDMLQRMMEQLAEKSARLDESGLREFLNSRENEAANLMSEIREAIAEGRLDEAQELMERLSELVEEMGRGIREEFEKRTSEGEEAQDQADELKTELKAIEEEQRKLQSEVQALRDQDTSGAQEMAELWAELARLADDHRRSADAYTEALTSNRRAFYERERAAAGVEVAVDLQGAIAAKDVRGARTAIGGGRRAWMMAHRALEIERDRRRSLPGPGPRELSSLLRQLDRIEELLDQLDQAEQQMDPAAREQAGQMEDRQRDLDNRLEQAQEQAKQMQQQFPVRPEGMEEALQDAGERMEQASEDLEGGQLMQAEGSQGVAAQRIRDAIESIEQAQQQAQQQSQQLSGEPQDSGEGKDQREGEGKEGDEMKDDQRMQDLEIPGREEFRTPEEYRRALLDGMEGEVPEEYRAMKRRYYEELVHQ